MARAGPPPGAALRARPLPPAHGPLLAWLHALRDCVHEYDAPPPAPPAPPAPPDSPDSAFDEILSQLGEEIFKLEQYRRRLAPAEPAELGRSVLDIFDECLEGMERARCSTPRGVRGIASAEVSETTEVWEETEALDASVSPGRSRASSASSGALYAGAEPGEWSQLLESSASDASDSTGWSYRGEAGAPRAGAGAAYAALWASSAGFHRSDAILRRVVAAHRCSHAEPPPAWPGCALAEPAVGAMTPRRASAPGPAEENIYEEIEFREADASGAAWSDGGWSCGSVELESWPGSGRASPLYANLADPAAYALPPDVLAWKEMLLDPGYCDDEEHEWIAGEECSTLAREPRDPRAPLVIPRISHYRPPHRHYHEESPIKASLREHGAGGAARMDYSPLCARADHERSFSKASSDSPPFSRFSKKLSGSSEQLAAGAAGAAGPGGARRPQQLALAGADGPVEVRGPAPARHARKSHSVHVGHKHARLPRSPLPAPRAPAPLPPPRHLPEVPFQVLHEGPVKKTRYVENNKKCRKNWTDCYMLLTPTSLYFYKDQKACVAARQGAGAGSPPSPGAPRADPVLPLEGACVLPCKPHHTRRHNKSLWLAVHSDEFLVQDETELGCERWYEEIQRVIVKQSPFLSEPALPLQSSSTDLESLSRTPPAARAKPANKQKAGGSSNEDLSDSTERSHVKKRLRDFFARRPGMDYIKGKGYYKDEPVFGRALEEVAPAGAPRVPDFVAACVREIESSEEHLATDGLYRASGNLSQVQKLRLEIDQTNKKYEEVIRNNYTDIHVLTGSLKLFFRELKEPLIPCSMFDRILAACSLKPKEVKIKEFRDIINSLPQCNRDTLKFLLEHLLRVTKFSERNRMHTANLAIVFGPTLLWAPAAQAHNIAVDCIQQNNVVDLLLTHFHDVFLDDSAKGKKKA